MRGTVQIKTRRLILRKYCPEDAEILFQNFGTDREMYRYSGWNPYATREMARETVQHFIDSYTDPRFYGWAIESAGRVIGTIGAYDYDSEENRIETGISIERDSWGRGFASEALEAVLQYLTGEEGIGCVTAWCASDNTGSRRAMEKAGMRMVRTDSGGLSIRGETYDRLDFSFVRKSRTGK